MEALFNEAIDLPGGPQVRVAVWPERQVEIDFRTDRTAIWAPRVRVNDAAFDEDDTDRLAKDIEHAEGVDELAMLLADARERSRKLANVIREAEGELAARMDSRIVTIEGFGTLERRWSSKMKWDDSLAIGALIDAAMEQKVHPRDAILACAGVSYWRTGELKRFGLDPDKYRRSEGDGRYTVSIVRAKDAA